MTNQEAIRLMRNLPTMCEFTDAYGEPIDSDAYYEAVDMAISALQAQDSPKPTAGSVQNVPKEDLISRKAAIDAECEVCQIAPKKERGHNCTYYVHGCKEIECLRALPSAQPEPCDDAVSREAIESILYELYEVCTNMDELVHCMDDNLKKLPSVQPEPQWIPVSERLPEEKEFVLVTFGWFGRKTDPEVNIDEMRDGDWMISEVVTAWMPLPEPYRAERRTE